MHIFKIKHQSKQLIKVESVVQAIVHSTYMVQMQLLPWRESGLRPANYCELWPVCYLDDSLSVWLEAELRDDAELYLGAEREHELLVADHAVTGLLPRHMQPGCGHGVSARGAR